MSDNKPVQLASNYVFIDPVNSVDRWQKNKRKMISVPRCHIINAWLRYRKNYVICNKKGQFHGNRDKNLTLIQFTVIVSSALVKIPRPAPKKRVGRPALNHTNSRLDSSFSPKRPRKAPN